MKKLKYLFLIMVSTFISISSVDAELLYKDQSFGLFGRRFSEFPFNNYFDPNETTSYTDTNVFEIAATSTSNFTLPKYIYAISCATGQLELTTSSGSKGSIADYSQVIGGHCTVNGYDGFYYLDRWTVGQWRYYTNDNSGTVYGIKWNITVHNSLPYTVFVRYDSVFASNDLISDFSNEHLLLNLINQNSNLRSELNEIKSNSSETNNKLDKTNEELGKVNDNITNDEVNGVENSFESFESFISENSTITQLITMPITLYSSILNGLQSTCQPFNLGNLFGTNLTMPCINIGSYLGSSLWSMIDIIISGFAIFSIGKKFIKIFNNFSSMKEGDVIDD